MDEECLHLTLTLDYRALLPSTKVAEREREAEPHMIGMGENKTTS